MKTCKFCGIHEGAPDRRGDAAHINRDNLCAPCNYVLERVKRQPERLSVEDWDWFNGMCEFNIKHGMFVPVAQRRALKHLKPWQCKQCGTLNDTNRDPHYTNYCVACATDIRCRRDMPVHRRPRSDKGSTHYAPLRAAVITKPDRRLGRRQK